MKMTGRNSQLIRGRRSRLSLALSSAFALGATGSFFADAAPLGSNHVAGTRGAQAWRHAAEMPAALLTSSATVVTNCDDSGSGSLRDAIASGAAQIDLSHLTCSTITLTSGALVLPNTVTLYGPGPDALTIDGANRNPVIEQFAGHGDLTLRDLTIAHGYSYGYALIAGGITSSGTLTLDDVHVTGCVHYAFAPGTVTGGGIIAERIDLEGSTVSGNTASSAAGRSYAGGIWSWRSANIVASTIDENVAAGNPGNTGGLAADGDLAISASTISGNRASYNAGVAGFGNYATTAMTVEDSTISGNIAYVAGGGIGMNPASVVDNSTIAFNLEYGGTDSAGLFLGPGANSVVRSTIIADNYSGAVRDDVGGAAGATLGGDHDLIMASSLPTPLDTLTGDPELMPLADNGGQTNTHAIPSSSPARDAGSNPDDFDNDQRGLGFARLIGSSVDIGAYEIQSAGVVTTVANCEDGGVGSLRDVVAHANSGDTIDLSALSCGKITLTTGELQLTQANLTLQGPGAAQLAIDGNHASRIIDHQGVGILTVSGLTLSNGVDYVSGGNATGGCIYSISQVVVASSELSGCQALGDTATGGAISADRLTISNSTMDANGVSGTQVAVGGALYVLDDLSMNACSLTGNTAPAGTLDNGGEGGAIFNKGPAYVSASTFSHNSAAAGGALFSKAPMTLIDSTISGNSAEIGGGIVAYAPVTLRNSTVAFNVSEFAAYPAIGSGLLAVYGPIGLYSTIIFANTSNGVPYDVGVKPAVQIIGAHSLVGTSPALLPPDTIHDDPLLGPLQDNGGPTQTHALSAGSPAIDHGDNDASLIDDQRGDGFARVVGTAADIGSFEVQATSDDRIFADGFDGG